LTTCYYYVPFNRYPVSRTLSAVDVSVLNADEVAALWRAPASETVSPLGRLPVERVTADCRLRAALSVDQRPHRRTRGAICRTSLSTWKHGWSSVLTYLLYAQLTNGELYRAQKKMSGGGSILSGTLW